MNTKHSINLLRGKSLSTRFRAVLAAAILFAATAPALAALPNSWDLISRTIPASACEVRDKRQMARVELVQGGWRFVGSTTGRVTLTCPLPISYFPADHDLAAGDTEMTFYRVWYRDSDGPGAVTSVSATPYLRTDTGAWTNIGLVGGGGGFVPPGVCQFNSNSHPNLAFATNIQDCAHDIQLNVLYSFEVTLQRNSTSQIVEFHGIDFWDGSLPQG